MTSYEVKDRLDVVQPRQAVVATGHKLGFSRSACHELAIVVSELASNIVKYGISGHIEHRTITDPEHGVGIMVIADDRGPPFHDLSLAIQDGYNDRGPIDPGTLLKRGGIGAGLGAIVRLTDVFVVEAREIGKTVRATRFVKRPRRLST
jgi:anti-sigma regulatory factor (Ser/Thr protein kinase)